MKFIVDEIPCFADQCPFYNSRNGTCKLDCEECERFGKDGYYPTGGECHSLKVLIESEDTE